MGDSSLVRADGADTSDVTGKRSSLFEDPFLESSPAALAEEIPLLGKASRTFEGQTAPRTPRGVNDRQVESSSQNVTYVSPDLIRWNKTPRRNTNQGARSLNPSTVSWRTSDLDRDVDWNNTVEYPILLRSPLKPNTRNNYTECNPIFRPVSKSKPVIEVVFDVFEEMKKHLIDKAHEDGHVYAFRLPKYPGVIKIGRTRRKISTRMAEVEVCAGGRLELLNAGDHISIPNHEGWKHWSIRNLNLFGRV